MSHDVQLFDLVALLEDAPSHGLHRGHVGTVVEELAPGVFEVEFSGNDGRAYAFASVEARHLLKLRHEPAAA